MGLQMDSCVCFMLSLITIAFSNAEMGVKYVEVPVSPNCYFHDNHFYSCFLYYPYNLFMFPVYWWKMSMLSLK